MSTPTETAISIVRFVGAASASCLEGALGLLSGLAVFSFVSVMISSNPKTKKPTWRNTLGRRTTSAYFSTGLPPRRVAFI